VAKKAGGKTKSAEQQAALPKNELYIKLPAAH